MQALLMFDIQCLAKSASVISPRTAAAHVLLWFVIGLVFNLTVAVLYGSKVAIIWFNGYILEYMLSIDNVFFFHVVFRAYNTPPTQTYKVPTLPLLSVIKSKAGPKETIAFLAWCCATRHHLGSSGCTVCARFNLKIDLDCIA